MLRIFFIFCLLLPVGLAVAAAAGDPLSPAKRQQICGQVSRLLGELDSDCYEVRRSASMAMEALLARPELGRLLSAEFRRVLVRTDVSFEVRWHLERWARRLPEVSPEPAKELPPEKLQRLMRLLEDDSYSVRSGALRRLKWLLLRDEHLPRVKEAIRSRLANPTQSETGAELRKLLALTRPAMVAEYWREGRHLAEQHLLIGVPSLGEGAVRPSHFDRIDDRVAHCVSGNNLSPGDYPVGVAFPHPKQPGAFFHLVNLSTPRRRLAYAEHVKIDDAVRLAAISRRTLDRMLAEKHQLSQPELIMLGQLDPKEVSRFAGRYFHILPDRQLPHSEYERQLGLPSRFGAICAQLAHRGTQEAMPGLVEALENGCFLPPTSASPYQYPWLAALAIAIRDPWSEVDAWLAGKLERSDRLVEGRPDGPELGATAAGILLARHKQSPTEFDLRPTPDPLMLRFGIDGYRFPSPEARKKVQQWWDRQRAK